MPKNTSQLFKYVALGDSLANGVGADGVGYPHHLNGLLSQNKEAQLHLFAISGQTSTQLLKRWSTYQDALSQANLITWNIGGNDLRITWRMYGHSQLPTRVKNKQMEIAITKMVNNWNILAKKLRETAPPNTIIVALNQYNPYITKYPDTERFIKKANKLLEMICENHHIILIDAYQLINRPAKPHTLQDFLALDGLHLNAQGYERLARVIYEIAYPQTLLSRVRAWLSRIKL